jgi:pimeloyl-ACP methyl ester carboxylesterase
MYNVTDPVHSSIVFVHGLTGSSDTWLHKQSATHWPRDLLPQCFSDAHILQFVYDADVLRLWNPVSQSRISNHAKNILGGLARLRERTDSKDRKIFFVVYSLGGLVTQAALSQSRRSLRNIIERLNPISKASCF